jgi:4-carboxymuconolactone decarboxylase
MDPARSRMPLILQCPRRPRLLHFRIEIVTNIINGKWRASYGNHEHEQIGVKQGHLDQKTVEALIAGLPTSSADSRQQVIYELASTLANRRFVPTGLYKRCKDLLGDARHCRRNRANGLVYHGFH